MLKNVSRTAFAHVSSSVNRVRSQSQDEPSLLSWPRMRFSYLSFHSQIFSTSFSRPIVVAVERLLLRGEQPFHHGLRGDPGVVGARHPEGVVALHPPPADQHVLQRVVQRVPHVQGPGHVRRRDDDRVRRLLSHPASNGNSPSRPRRSATSAGRSWGRRPSAVRSAWTRSGDRMRQGGDIFALSSASSRARVSARAFSRSFSARKESTVAPVPAILRIIVS